MAAEERGILHAALRERWAILRAMRSDPKWWLWFFYVLPMFGILFVSAVILWLPWTFCKCCRPSGTRNGKHIKHTKFDPYRNRKERVDNVLAFLCPIGDGPESEWNGGTMMFHLWWRRTWGMYQWLREVLHMTDRQGLQVLGVMSGLIILTMQAEMIGHDYMERNVSDRCLGDLSLPLMLRKRFKPTTAPCGTRRTMRSQA